MRSTLWTCLLMLCIAGVYFNGCQTADQQSELADIQQDDGEDDFADASEDSQESDEEEDVYSSEAPHPKEASAWFTRKLIMTSRQPSADSINRCSERVDSISSQAPNLRAMQDASASLESSVSDNPRIFHWCFYQMMADLDIKLSNDVSLMEEKSEIFMSRMKSLWVLGKALDDSGRSNRYIKYLKARYTEINQTVFGRRLEQMSANDFRLPVSGRGKSAIKFDEQD